MANKTKAITALTIISRFVLPLVLLLIISAQRNQLEVTKKTITALEIRISNLIALFTETTVYTFPKAQCGNCKQKLEAKMPIEDPHEAHLNDLMLLRKMEDDHFKHIHGAWRSSIKAGTQRGEDNE